MQAEGIGPAVGMSQVAAVSQMLKALQPGGSSSGKVLDSVKDCRKGFFSLTAAASIAGDDARYQLRLVFPHCSRSGCFARRLINLWLEQNLKHTPIDSIVIDQQRPTRSLAVYAVSTLMPRCLLLFSKFARYGESYLMWVFCRAVDPILPQGDSNPIVCVWN
jgi:hypothetical protein